jgi:isoquinoline 1-oxidoreductase beta subunit
LLDDDAPLKRVLEVATTQAGWGTPLPEGWGRGLACHVTWGVTPVAQVADVSVADDGTVRVQRVVCAIDCGTVVNPDMVEAQMEGGIIVGLYIAVSVICLSNNYDV